LYDCAEWWKSAQRVRVACDGMDMNARKSTSLMANGTYRFSVVPMMDWTERQCLSMY
jgi:hypothetical protein